MELSKHCGALLAFYLLAGTASAQDAGRPAAIVKTLELGQAPALIASRCSACHDWAASYDAIIASGLVTPGKPEESRVWIMVESGTMPADGTSLDADQKALLRDWIAAGAPKPAEGSAPGSAKSASSGPSAAPLPASRFLGFKNKEDFHRFSGWASGGILLAAGIVGAVHAYDMFSVAHAWRDAHYPNMDNFDPAICPAEVAAVYDDPTQQALGWTHVGLVAAGETFYIANAITGTSFMGKLGPGWTKAKVHRYAFFTHATLMVAQIVMGFYLTDALNRGDHETFSNLMIAHAGVGLAIPIVILGAGAIMDSKVKF